MEYHKSGIVLLLFGGLLSLLSCEDVASHKIPKSVFGIQNTIQSGSKAADRLCVVDKLALDGNLIYDSLDAQPIRRADVWRSCHITWGLRPAGDEHWYYLQYLDGAVTPAAVDAFTLGAATELFCLNAATELRQAEELEIVARLAVVDAPTLWASCPLRAPILSQLQAAAKEAKAGTQDESPDESPMEKVETKLRKEPVSQFLADSAADSGKEFTRLKVINNNDKSLIADCIEEKLSDVIAKSKLTHFRHPRPVMLLPTEVKEKIGPKIMPKVQKYIALLTENSSRPLGAEDVSMTFIPYDQNGELVCALKIRGYEVHYVELAGFRAKQDIEDLTSDGLKNMIKHILASEMTREQFLTVARQCSLAYELATQGQRLEQCEFTFEAHDAECCLEVYYIIDGLEMNSALQDSRILGPWTFRAVLPRWWAPAWWMVGHSRAVRRWFWPWPLPPRPAGAGLSPWPSQHVLLKEILFVIR